MGQSNSCTCNRNTQSCRAKSHIYCTCRSNTTCRQTFYHVCGCRINARACRSMQHACVCANNGSIYCRAVHDCSCTKNIAMCRGLSHYCACMTNVTNAMIASRDGADLPQWRVFCVSNHGHRCICCLNRNFCQVHPARRGASRGDRGDVGVIKVKGAINNNTSKRAN